MLTSRSVVRRATHAPCRQLPPELNVVDVALRQRLLQRLSAGAGQLPACR